MSRDSRDVPAERVDVLVIGSGVAGLSVALGAAGRRVCVVTPQQLGFDGSSMLAQGGIAAAMGEDDSPGRHAGDTLAAGAGRCDPTQVARLTAAAPAAVEWLAGLGCPLDRFEDGRLSLGLEAAHSRARIVHAGGDRSGALLMAALVQAIGKQESVSVRAGWRAVAPLLSASGVTGARVRARDGSLRDIHAGATVLATGGLTALFECYTGSPQADGGGHCFASEAGAALSDLEFVQFHPTAFAGAGSPSGAMPLLTEALRGAGARDRDDAAGAAARLRRRDGSLLFGLDDGEGGDLGPRDRVARAVHEASRSGGAFLDLRGGLAGRLAQSFPTAAALCRQQGIDPARELVPVSPAAHYHMGGITVDAAASTSVPGLYAVGEVACTGVHGANRLASNSLLEGLAFGRDLGQRLAASERLSPAVGGRFKVGAPVADMLAPDVHQRLGACLWRAVGPVRDAGGLLAGLAELEQLAFQVGDAPAAMARIRLAEVLLQAALRRTDSVGAHWRSDVNGAEAVPVLHAA